MVETWAELEDRVRTYELTWWLDDASAAAQLARRPALRERLLTRAETGVPVGTDHVYLAQGTWAPVRAARHAEIFRHLAAPTTPAEPAPTAFVIMGKPGAGKSTLGVRVASAWLATHGKPPVDRRFDPDEVRVLLPEFRDGSAPASSRPRRRTSRTPQSSQRSSTHGSR